jgi:hypothetical protein
MNVFITRNPGWYGKFARLDLLCNGKRLASIREKETVQVRLEPSDLPATLELRMQNVVGSPSIELPCLLVDLYLECGANKWMLMDFFDLSLLPGLRNKVFYFRKLVPAW